MGIPERLDQCFSLMKESQGMCRAPKCKTPAEILSLLDFLLLEEVNLGDDPVKGFEICFVHAVNYFLLADSLASAMLWKQLLMPPGKGPGLQNGPVSPMPIAHAVYFSLLPVATERAVDPWNNMNGDLQSHCHREIVSEWSEGLRKEQLQLCRDWPSVCPIPALFPLAMSLSLSGEERQRADSACPFPCLDSSHPYLPKHPWHDNCLKEWIVGRVFPVQPGGCVLAVWLVLGCGKYHG